jgi:hypothetical protein
VSLEVISRVWDKSEQSSSGLVVMQALAWYADKKGVCWPGVDELAKRSRLKERNTQYILKQLEAELEIFRLRHPGKGLRSYTVVTVGYGAGYLYRVLRQSLMLDKQFARQLIAEWSKGATESQKVQSTDNEKVQSNDQKVQSGGVKVQSSVAKGAIQRKPYKERTVRNRQEPSEKPDPASQGADAPTGALPVRNLWAGFGKRFRAKYDLPYSRRDGDSAQIKRAREDYGGELNDATWDTACDNYFASPLAEHTMRDLCSRFPTFLRSALDRFKAPVADLHNRNGDAANVKSSVSEQRLRQTMERRAREDEEDRGHLEQVPIERQLAGLRRR